MERKPDYQAEIFQSLGKKQLLAIVELVARLITEHEEGYAAYYVAEDILHYPLDYFPNIVTSYCDSLKTEIDKILFLQRVVNVLASEAATGKFRANDFDDEERA